MPEQTLRGAIIGCGFFAQFHLEAWRRMPDVQIAAACDPDLDRARAAAPRAYSSAEKLFRSEHLDFVDIATRPETHLELVSLAVSHRVPVICQKPMAPSWKQCVQMVEAAETANVPFMIHENWRWQPWYRVLKSAIARGDIGEPIGYRFRAVKRDGIGPEPYPAQPYFRHMPRLLIYETIVHHLDTARFLFGDFKSVFAEIRKLNPLIAGEDQAFLTLTHTQGLLGAIEGNRWTDTDPKDAPGLGESWFDGTEGRLSITPEGVVLRGTELLWQPGKLQGYRGDSVMATQRHFLESLCRGSAFETGGREYLGTVAAMEAAYQSAGARRKVDI